MLKKLIGLCLRGGDPKDPGIRRRCGAISGGMGIGLSLGASMVRAHGGAMTVENAREGGAVFSFVLPMEKGEEI